jgi:hypothetical protein
MNGCSQVKRNGLIYAGSVVGMASEGEFDSEDSSEGGALQFWTRQTRHTRARAPTQTHTNVHKRARTHTTRRQDSYSRCGHALDCGVVDGHANPSQVFVHRGEIVHIQKHLEIAIAMAEQRPLHRSQDAPFLAAGSWRSRST